MTIKCAVVGLGYWGPNIARSIAANPDVMDLVALCDSSSAQLSKIASRYPKSRLESDAYRLLSSPDIDAVFLAVPLKHHFELANLALRAGKHVFVEKPFVQTSDEAMRLIEVAAAKRCTLMVDHVFVYAPAVRKIRSLVERGDLGKPLYYDSVRINLGLFQHDANALWDLAVHDLAIIDHVFGEKPVAVTATGVRHFSDTQESMAYLTCIFESGMLAHIHASWLSPVKVRRVLIGGESRMIAYDDIEPDEKLKIYDRGINVVLDAEMAETYRVGYRMGDIWVPNLDRSEPLQTAVNHFAQCIVSGAIPLTDGHAGLRAVCILEAANQAMTYPQKVARVT